MKHIQTFENFSQVNEITFAENKKVQNLLQKLKDKIKNTRVYDEIADFVKMDILDVYTTYDSIVNHLKQNFPKFFGKGKEYEMALAECVEIAKANEINEATKIENLAPYANTFKSAGFKDSTIIDVAQKSGYSVITVSSDNLTADQLSILINGGLKFVQPAGKGLKLLF
jgi:hypothetical protein